MSGTGRANLESEWEQLLRPTILYNDIAVKIRGFGVGKMVHVCMLKMKFGAS